MGYRISLTVAGRMLATVLVLLVSNLAISAPNPVAGEVRQVSDPLFDAQTNEMSYQMQILQQEVQDLRGLVEKLSYQLSRLQSAQDDRYLELDQRFQRLSEQSPGRLTISPPVNLSSTNESGSVGHNSDVLNLSQDDKTLYDAALELIRARQYDVAITQLRTLIAQYPDSPLAANAYYWMGEAYTARPDPDYEKARTALAQVITYFPEHRKVPDAAFKLGKVYNLMGDCKRSVELLKQVIKQQQGKSIAKVAQIYLRDKVGDCP